jgi:hypothetical protein
MALAFLFFPELISFSGLSFFIPIFPSRDFALFGRCRSFIQFRHPDQGQNGGLAFLHDLFVALSFPNIPPCQSHPGLEEAGMGIGFTTWQL